MDEITKRLEKRNAELSRINDALESKLAKLVRLVNQIDRLRLERKRLLKPRKLNANEALKITGEEWHQIRDEVDLNDPIEL